MEVLIKDFVEGAREAVGAVVVIDAFRAMSVQCYALAAQAREVFPVSDAEEALEISGENMIRIGERFGEKLPGFDFGNSPSELEGVDLSGKTVVQTTHAGTQGLVAVPEERLVFSGAFVNARATARELRALEPDCVTLVRMGLDAGERTDEDDLCAEYLKALLLEQPFDEEEIVPKLRTSPCAERFFDPAHPGSHEQDFWLCLEVNRFDFAIKRIRTASGRWSLKRYPE